MTSSGLKPRPAGPLCPSYSSASTQATASHWRDKVFHHFRLYAVTDIQQRVPANFLNTVESIYKNGADIVQLRSKMLPCSEKFRLGLAIKKIATKMHKLYFVNDALDLALLTKADGLHLGQDDLPANEIDKFCKKIKRRLFLGLSTHSEKQARMAQTQPVDYFGVGPVFSTPTKPSYSSVGLQLVQKVSRFAKKPWVAIGGIDLDNLGVVLENGACRVAVVRAIFAARNPAQSCFQMAQKIKEVHHV